MTEQATSVACKDEFELDICPFCGCPPELKQFGGHWAVICSNEFCVQVITRKTVSGQLESSFGTVARSRAVSFWNSQRFYLLAAEPNHELRRFFFALLFGVVAYFLASFLNHFLRF